MAYGLGYGLAKMGEGLTQGTLKGMVYKDQKETAQAKGAREDRRLGIAEQQVGLQRTGLDLQGQRLGIEQGQLDERGKANTWKNIGLSLDAMLKIGEQTNDWTKAAEVGNALYTRATGEKAGWLTGLQYDSQQDLMTIDLGDQMLLLPKTTTAQLAKVMSSNPERADEALQTMVRLGAGVVLPKGASPDAKVVAGSKGGSVATNPKVSEYVAGIKIIADKWKFDPGAFTNEDGSMNVEAFLGSKETAYSIMERKAKEGVSGAAEDLQKVKTYYEGLDQILRPKKAGGSAGEDPLGLGI